MSNLFQFKQACLGHPLLCLYNIPKTIISAAGTL